jgi:hypothetical protein
VPFNSLEVQSLLIMLLDSSIILISIQLLLQKLCFQSIYSKTIATPLALEFENMLLITIHFMAQIGLMIARINDSFISSLLWELIIKIMQKEIFSPSSIWLEPCSFTSLCFGHKRPQQTYGLMQLIKLFTYGIIFQILIPS